MYIYIDICDPFSKPHQASFELLSTLGLPSGRKGLTYGSIPSKTPWWSTSTNYLRSTDCGSCEELAGSLRGSVGTLNP